MAPWMVPSKNVISSTACCHTSISVLLSTSTTNSFMPKRKKAVVYCWPSIRNSDFYWKKVESWKNKLKICWNCQQGSVKAEWQQFIVGHNEFESKTVLYVLLKTNNFTVGVSFLLSFLKIYIYIFNLKSWWPSTSILIIILFLVYLKAKFHITGNIQVVLMFPH